MLKKIYLIIIITFLSQTALFAQDKPAQEKQDIKESVLLRDGRNEYKALKYTAAIKVLSEELKAHPDDQQAQEMIAGSYRNIKNYDQAAYWYGELTKSSNIKPEWALYYAEALASKQQYESSEHWYQKYLELVTQDSRAAAFIQSYPHINDFFKYRNEWKVAYLNINTDASEYSPMYYKDGLIFSSNRKWKGISRHVFEWDKTPFSDLYYVKNLADVKGVNIDSVKTVLRRDPKAAKMYKTNDDDTHPTSNDSRVEGVYNAKTLKDTAGNYLSPQVKVEPLRGAINSKYHEGASTLLPDGSIMFTRNNYYEGIYSQSKDGVNKLKLYTAKAPDFNDIQKFPYNDDQYSTGHPTVNKAGTLLVFASDMPGGHGGTDLYYCKRASIKDAWEKPVNMGSVINTEGNEMFPTLYQDSILYFASTGHPGLGGLDIFQVALKDVQPLHTPVNLGSPVNSPVDDFGIIRSEDGSTGYFTSNRKGSDDIYSFSYRPITVTLKGMVTDAATDSPLANSQVTIVPNNLRYIATDGQGAFSKTLQKETDYSVTAGKEGYAHSDAMVISSKGLTSDSTLTINIKLNKQTQPQVAATPDPVCDSLKTRFAVKKIYYDLDKSNIREDAHPELDHLIAILQSHPDLKIIVASYCDSRASVNYNMTLSMHRSQASRAYLQAHGIDTNKIQMEYFGKSRLVNKCGDGVPCSEADHQLNRRTEFILLKDGKELQDMDCGWLKSNVEK